VSLRGLGKRVERVLFACDITVLFMQQIKANVVYSSGVDPSF